MLDRVPYRARDIGFCAAAVLAMLLAQNVVRMRSPTPIGLFSDHVFLLSAARQMMEGQGFWNSDRVGFPLGQSSSYFPEFEPLLKLALFAVAQLPIGVFGVVKLFTVIGAVGIVVSAYWCLRRLGSGMVLAGVGAFVFAISPYYAVRTINHDYLSVYVSAPFGATLALLVARLESVTDLHRLGRSSFTWIALLVIATCGLYYAFFALMLLAVALLALAFRIRSLWPVTILATVSALTLVVLMVGALGPDLSTGLTGAPARMPVEQLFHGLSISDAIFSFSWVPGLGHVIASYKVLRPATLIGEGAQEWPSALITLAILASPLIVLCGSPSRLPSHDRFAAAGLIVFSIIMTSRGGIGYLFNELVTPAIRGQARVMPFLMFFGLFLCLSFAQDYWGGEGPWQRAAALAITVCLLVATIPYTNQFGLREAKMETDSQVMQSVRSFHGVVDAAQSGRLQIVLQLPVASWPELPPRNGYDYYTMHLPQVFDPRGSRTKWSYGSSQLQPGFKVFNATIRSELDPDGVAFRAHQIGFDGALVEKRALPIGEATRLMTALTTSRPSHCVLYDDPDRALIDIGRKPECAPIAAPDPAKPIEISLQGKGAEFLGNNFWSPQSDGTWAMTQESTLFLPMPGGVGPVTVHLTFNTLPSSLAAKHLTASTGGRQAGEFAVKTGSSNVIDIPVAADLAPAGRIMTLHLHFDCPESPFSLGFADPRPLSMLIQTIEISR